MPLVLALPPLVELVIGVAALLLAWASSLYLVKPLVWIVGQIPVIGGQIAQGATGLGAKVGEWVGTWIVGTIQGTINILDWASGSATYAIRNATSALSWAHDSIIGIARAFYSRMAAAESGLALVLTRAQALAAQVAGMASRVTAVAVQVAYLATVGLPGAIATATAHAVATSGQAIAAVRATLQAAIAAASAAALASIGQEAAARASADAAIRAAAAAEAALIGRQAAAALAAQEAAIGAEVGQIGQAIDGIAAKIGPIAFPTVAIGLTTIQTLIRTLERDCINPTCGFIGPQLGALEALEDVALLAAVAELVAHAAQHPQAAAADTIGDAGPLLGAVSGLFRELTGIQV